VEFLIQILISIITLVFTIWIPIKVSWEQQYSSLLDEYRGYDYAIAYQGIVQFFVNECGNDMERVKEAYKRRFLQEIENKPGNINKENCLHFQRRLLAQFFWQLNECANSHVIKKSRIARDFTKGEAKLIKILIYMGEAVENDEIMFKDISSSAIVKKPEHIRGQNRSLSELYQLLKNSKRYLE
jgi:hypothetical protein